MRDSVAAISVGVINNEIKLDLDYELDSSADVDMNVIKTSDGRYVEIQGTGEESTFSGEELIKLLSVADGGIDTIFEAQKIALEGIE